MRFQGFLSIYTEGVFRRCPFSRFCFVVPFCHSGGISSSRNFISATTRFLLNDKQTRHNRRDKSQMERVILMLNFPEKTRKLYFTNSLIP
jgi:hypothetical protein